MNRDSIFRKSIERKENRLYVGFSYRNKIIEKTVSPYNDSTPHFASRVRLNVNGVCFFIRRLL